MRALFVQKIAGIAGSELYLLKILPELRGQGIDCEMVSVVLGRDVPKAVAFEERLAATGVPIHRVDYEHAASPRIPARIAALSRRVRADVVHAHLVHADVWCAAARPLLPRSTVLVSTKHGYEERYQREHGFDPRHRRIDAFYAAERASARVMDRCAAISEGLGRFLSVAGICEAAKLDVIPYGFDFSTVDTSDLTGCRFAEHQLVLVGRLVPVKGHERALDVLARVRAEVPGTKLVLVGGGPLETELRERAAGLGLADAVVMLGFRPDPHRFLRASDVALVTSTAEGFGAVVLEAWHNERAVVSFDVPAVNEVIEHGADGFLARPFDAREMAERVVSLLRDPVRREEMGRRGKAKLLERYTLEAMVASTLRFYARAARARGRHELARDAVATLGAHGAI